MKSAFSETQSLPDFHLWDRMDRNRALLDLTIELTARCNHDCRHCYINLPAGDRSARERELTLEELHRISDEAVELGALWILLTGGEPLLREDFADIFVMLKRKGLLVSVFTNAALVTGEHIKLFREFPPREIEVTVYGASQAVYEQVTRKKGSWRAFRRGVDLLLDAGIPVGFKAMALRSNLDGIDEIERFCRERSNGEFRLDPLLHLRYDGDRRRNEEIAGERLSPQEIVNLEEARPERLKPLVDDCHNLLHSGGENGNRLFKCAIGRAGTTVGWDGTYRLCGTLCHPECTYDLRRGSLKEARQVFSPTVERMEADSAEFAAGCGSCDISGLCFWCPANAHLEHGRLDAHASYFCEVAHARARMLRSISVSG